MQSTHSPADFRLVGAASLLMALAIPVLMWTLGRMPPRETLESAAGIVRTVEQDEYGVNFQLRGDHRLFFYARKYGGLDRVEFALAQGASKPLTVLFDPERRTPSEGRPFHEVLALDLDGKPVRTYEQARLGWKQDNLYGYATVAFFLLMAGVMEHCARKVAREQES